ncbi:hypothetical protein SprV_0100483400 [Sparganum proliferum]
MLANRFELTRRKLDGEDTAMPFGGRSPNVESYALPTLTFEGHSSRDALPEDDASGRDHSAGSAGGSAERSAKYKPECFLTVVLGPCLIRPVLQDIPSQRVKQMFLNGSDFVVYLETVENSVVYLPCGTRKELQNEANMDPGDFSTWRPTNRDPTKTVIWEHNFTTISVMGTLFTMDKRLDAASAYNNFQPCEGGALLTSSVKAGHQIPPRGRSELESVNAWVQMWELVISGVRPSDSGVYTCRLTGEAPQNIKYYLSVKPDETNQIFSRRSLILPQWQFVHQMEKSGYCLVTSKPAPLTSFSDETRHVLSDSPNERHALPTGRQPTVLRFSDAFSRLTTAPITSVAHSLTHLKSTLALTLVKSASNHFMWN